MHLHSETLNTKGGLDELGDYTHQQITLGAGHPLVQIVHEIKESLELDESGNRDALYDKKESVFKDLGIDDVCRSGMDYARVRGAPHELLDNAIEHGINFGQNGTLSVDVYRSKTSTKALVVLEQPKPDFDIGQMRHIAETSRREVHDSLRGLFLTGAFQGDHDSPLCQFNYEKNPENEKLRTVIMLDYSAE